MPDVSSDTPSNIADNLARQHNAESYVGKNITDICANYDDDGKNHCAHFVSHVLDVRLPGAALCSNVDGTKYRYEDRRAGYCIRVDQIFNKLNNRCDWPAVDPTGNCIAVATIEGNIQRSTVTIGENSTKHIGIYSGGIVYHYSNTGDKVVKASVASFKRHYGPNTVVLKADLP